MTFRTKLATTAYLLALTPLAARPPFLAEPL